MLETESMDAESFEAAVDSSPSGIRRSLRPDQGEILRNLESELAFFKNKAMQLDDRVFQMRALLQSGKGFSEILNLQALLHAFMAVCRERYGALSSTVLLLDDLDQDNIFYRVRGFHGLPDSYIGPDGHREEILLFKIPHDQGLLWQVVQQGEVFSVTNMQGLPRFKTAFRHWGLQVLDSQVWVPLVRGGQVLGILTLGECEDGVPISETDYAFLEEIAAVAATNIDSTLKYEKNARILTNLRTLYDVNQQLANVNDFKELTIETLATAVGALKAQKANLMLYNPETERLEIKVVWGNIPKHTRDAINDGRMTTKSFALGEGVAGLAAKQRTPVRRNDRTKIEQMGRNIVYCIMSVPLVYGGEVMGVMTLTNKVRSAGEDKTELDTLGRYGEDDEQLLLGLADQAAVNLHKARLYSASITDRLTGLYNARHFETRMQWFVEETQRSGETVSLAVTDIDHFKRFNDEHGHKAGDVVLASTAGLLKDMVRESTLDACFRYGGEEFCMVMPDTQAAEAAALLEEFRERVAEACFEYENKTLKVTVSVGISSCPDNATERKELFEAADKALYAAKDAGRDRVMLMNGTVPTLVTKV